MLPVTLRTHQDVDSMKSGQRDALERAKKKLHAFSGF
jgi:hypothetical protein